MVSSKLLKTKAAKENVNQEYLTYKPKTAQSTFNLKINSNRSSTVKEMFDLAEILNTDPGDLGQFFLTQTYKA